MKSKVIIALSILVVTGVLLWLGHFRSKDRTGLQPAGSGASEPQAQGSSKNATASEVSDEEALKGWMKATEDFILKHGGRKIGSAKQLIDEAIATGDRGEISRAFDEAIYNRFARMEEALPALREYLAHEDWYVRMRAAENLYVTGDTSGYDVLHGILTSPTPIMDLGVDQRVRVAQMLGRFREHRAAQAILEAYQNNWAEKMRMDSNYILPLMQLGIKEAVPFILEASNGALDESAAVMYGWFASPAAKELLEAALQRPNASEEFQASVSWALYQIEPKEEYYHTIRRAAEAALEIESYGGDRIDSAATRSFQLLAAIKKPEVARFMEECLISTVNNVVRDYAAASLSLIQEGESAVLNSFLIEAFENNQTDLLLNDLVFHLALRSTDPAVHAAGERFDSGSSTKRWRDRVRRKDWSIYPWADGVAIVP